MLLVNMLSYDRLNLFINPFAVQKEGSGIKFRIEVLVNLLLVSAAITAIPFLAKSFFLLDRKMPSESCLLNNINSNKYNHLKTFLFIKDGILGILGSCVCIMMYLIIIFKVTMASDIQSSRKRNNRNRFLIIRTVVHIISILLHHLVKGVYTIYLFTMITISPPIFKYVLMGNDLFMCIINSLVYTLTTPVVTEKLKSIRFKCKKLKKISDESITSRSNILK